MNETKLRMYTMQVKLTFDFYDIVEVAATSEQEARGRAIGEAWCDWSNSRRIEAEAFPIAVEEP